MAAVRHRRRRSTRVRRPPGEALVADGAGGDILARGRRRTVRRLRTISRRESGGHSRGHRYGRRHGIRATLNTEVADVPASSRSPPTSSHCRQATTSYRHTAPRPGNRPRRIYDLTSADAPIALIALIDMAEMTVGAGTIVSA